MQWRDTVLDLNSEGGMMANKAVDGVPYVYMMDYAILRLTVVPKNTSMPAQVRYLKIRFSYGC